MATEVLMPKQGNTVESCIITEWKVKEGDTVKKGDVLCEVETDKATFEVEAPADGTVLALFFPEEADVPVLTPIAAIGEPGEDVSALRPAEASGADEPQAEKAPEQEPEKKAEKSPAPQPAAPASPPAPGGEVKASPRARNLAARKGVNLSCVTGTGPDGRIIERDVKAAAPASISPAAAEKAAREGLQVPAEGSGIGGRVLSTDLTAAAAAATAEAPAFPGPTEEIPVKGIRKIVAERMLASLQNSAQLTLHASADARAVLGYRAKCKAAPEESGLNAISINDIVLYAVARTLVEFPDLNAHWLGDKMVRFAHVHLGFAVDTPRGLMVPVIRFADRLSLRALSAEAKRLAKACQEGNIEPDLLTSGTFTVTNLGALGIERFTPVLNVPEVAILGVCAVVPRPVMNDSEVEFVPHMGLSLTIDHCAVDGAPAARFLAALRRKLAAFELTLAG